MSIVKTFEVVAENRSEVDYLASPLLIEVDGRYWDPTRNNATRRNAH